MENSFKTPKKSVFKIPQGYIIVDRKWKDTNIWGELKRKFNGVAIEDLKNMDFRLSEDKQVIYISEVQLVTSSNFDKLTECSKANTVIIADRNTVTADHYSRLQDSLVIKAGFNLYPIGNISELPEFLYALSMTESAKTPNNQYKRKSFTSSNNQQLQILLMIPQLGKLKAQKLLDKFGTIHNIALSSINDLCDVIGQPKASQVHKFFNEFR